MSARATRMLVLLIALAADTLCIAYLAVLISGALR
jgi:hypothetical protein